MVTDPDDDKVVDGAVEQRHLLRDRQVREEEVADLPAGQLQRARRGQDTGITWGKGGLRGL